MNIQRDKQQTGGQIDRRKCRKVERLKDRKKKSSKTSRKTSLQTETDRDNTLVY